MEKLIIIGILAFICGLLGWTLFFKSMEFKNSLTKASISFGGFIIILISLSILTTIISSVIKFYIGV